MAASFDQNAPKRSSAYLQQTVNYRSPCSPLRISKYETGKLAPSPYCFRKYSPIFSTVILPKTIHLPSVKYVPQSFFSVLKTKTLPSTFSSGAGAVFVSCVYLSAFLDNIFAGFSVLPASELSFLAFAAVFLTVFSAGRNGFTKSSHLYSALFFAASTSA